MWKIARLTHYTTMKFLQGENNKQKKKEEESECHNILRRTMSREEKSVDVDVDGKKSRKLLNAEQKNFHNK